eukprot:7169197-Heterocapsa_arctica.AAC.1
MERKRAEGGKGTAYRRQKTVGTNTAAKTAGRHCCLQALTGRLAYSLANLPGHESKGETNGSEKGGLTQGTRHDYAEQTYIHTYILFVRTVELRARRLVRWSGQA